MKSVRLVRMLAIALALPETLAQELFEVNAIHRYSLEHASSAMAIADLDGDGSPDAAVTHVGQQRLSIVLTRGGDPPAMASHEVGLSPLHLSSGDLDSSGALDLVTVNSGSSSLSVLRNGGDGKFSDAVEVRVTGAPRAAWLADLDDDGALDAAVISVTGGELGIFSLLAGDGQGRLRETSRFHVGDNPHSMSVQDFDGDGDRDFAVAHTSTISLFRGSGKGQFERPLDTSLRENPRGIAAGDFDQDTLPDLIVTTDLADLLFLRQLGSGLFEPSVLFNTGIAGARDDAVLRVLDFDGDALDDVAIQARWGASFGIRLVRGLGAGAFEAAEDVVVGDSSSDFALVDWDADAVLDLAVGQPAARELGVVIGRRRGRIQALASALTKSPSRNLAAIDWLGDGETLVGVPVLQGLQLLSLAPARAFEAAQFVPMAQFFVDIAAADLDGQPGDEVVLTEIVGPSLVIAGRDAAGSISPRGSHTFDGFPTRVRTADLDRDGSIDIVAGTKKGLRFLFGDGKGGVARQQETDLIPTAAAYRFVDWDGDGALELACVLPPLAAVQIVPGWALGDATLAAPLLNGHLLTDFLTLDVNGDGLLDLLGSTESPSPGVLASLGLAGGGLSAAAIHPVAGAPMSLAAADLDRDGGLDCATANFASSSVSVLWGRAPEIEAAFRRGDANADGKIDLADAVSTLHALFLGAGPLACADAADADDSGALNLTDPVAILVYLFQGGAPPPVPGPSACGADASADELAPCQRSCL